MSPARTRRVLKWAATSLLALVVIGGGLNCLWAVRYVGPDVMWGAIGGTVIRGPSSWLEFTEPPTPGGFHVWWCPNYGALGGASFGGQGFFILPLWIPAAALAAIVTLLWVLDRRRFPLGHCSTCGYNLTGNVSGRCPECGIER